MREYDHFDVEPLGDITRICLADPKYFEVDEFSHLRDELSEFVQDECPQKLLVDFSAVEYCSTAVINSFMNVRDALKTKGSELKFCGMSESVRDSFRMLNLDGSVFDIHSSQEAAIADF